MPTNPWRKGNECTLTFLTYSWFFPQGLSHLPFAHCHLLLNKVWIVSKNGKWQSGGQTTMLIHKINKITCVVCLGRNKLLQARWLNTTKMYSLTVLAPRNVKPRCLQGHAPSKGSREESFLAPSELLMVAGNLWYLWACNCITPISASVLM